ncbi:hypothetical protein J6590_010386 [Homalodisca vitripennis]|nr:hypothetical protein J6590_010386 [Homalodisca vitripennis]
MAWSAFCKVLEFLKDGISKRIIDISRRQAASCRELPVVETLQSVEFAPKVLSPENFHLRQSENLLKSREVEAEENRFYIETHEKI